MMTDDTMRVLKLIDHDAQFSFNEHQAGVKPVILNLSDLSRPDYIEDLCSQIFSEGAGADFIARCQCGETEGNNKVGMICPYCETEVTSFNLLDDNNLISKNWLSSPEELPGGWIAPKVYLNLANWLSHGKSNSKSRRNYLDDILDVDTPIPHDLSDVVTGKGFAYFHDNFDRLMQYFFFDHPVISKKADTAAMRLMLQLNREKVFCHYIPILDAAINPIISSDGVGENKKRYSDVTADYILKAAISLSSLKFAPKRKNRMLHVERTTYKAYKDIIAYVTEATAKYVSKKKAIPRTHIFGSRFHWSYRGVIVPIIGPHDYYELHMPWKMGVNSLRVHLRGRLCNRYGMSINEAVAKVSQSLQKVDPVIKQIMDEMIDESPFKGIPSLWQRPPSIRDGSVMLKFITKIKTDINDACISITPIDVALPNADFDGDNLAGIIIPEVEMAMAMRFLSPSALIYNRNTGEVSSEIGIHKSLAQNWNRFLGTV